MSSLKKGIADYLAQRRALGFKLRKHDSVLSGFASFLKREGASYITTELALRWAKQPRNAQPAHWAGRLSIVRGFAQYWSATDQRTEIPPPRLLPYRYQRRAPYIYTDDEILRLLEAARRLPSATNLRGWSLSTFFGLLAVAGLRINEGTALNRDDVDLSQGVLTVRRTKFGKTRLVPVHPSTQKVLRQYARKRDQIHPQPRTPSFFLSESGTRLSEWSVRRAFIRISRQIGLRRATDSDGPRPHDFRHAFAVKTLISWYRAGLDVERQMPLLSTYLGHTHVADTYWYLSAAPELLGLAAARLE
jgi:integrase